jgi:hypothetical protein
MAFDLPTKKPSTPAIPLDLLKSDVLPTQTVTKAAPSSVEVPDVDPFSGAATGYTTTVTPDVEKKYEDLPSIGRYPGFYTGTNIALGLSSTPEQVVDIVKNAMPNAKVGKDKYGNTTLNIGNERYLVDGPSPSALDVARFGVKTAASLPLAVGATALAPAESVGVPLAMGAQMAAGAGTSMGSQLYTKLFGNKQQFDYTQPVFEGLTQSAGPLVSNELTALQKMLAPDVFNTLPTGVRNFLTRFANYKYNESQRTPEMLMPEAKYKTDALLDNPNFQGIAKGIMGSDTEAARSLDKFLAMRDAGTEGRLLDDVNTHFGQFSDTDRSLDAKLKSYRDDLSKRLNPVLQNAGPVDVSDVVSTIDQLASQHPDTTDIGAALRKMRSFLVKSEGSGPVTTPRTPVYNNAVNLENAKQAIDRMINYGDTNIGIVPKTLSKDATIGQVRSKLSGKLKSIDGYSDIMNDYVDNFDQLEANKMGSDFLKGGNNALKPDQVASIMADPDSDVARAFVVGTRSAIDNKIRSTPNDIKALKSVLGGTEDNQRKNLELTFGENPVGNLLDSVGREETYQNTSNSLRPLQTKSQEESGQQFFEKTKEPMSLSKQGIVNKSLGPIDRMLASIRGERGPEFEQALADVLNRQGSNIAATREAQTGYSTPLPSRVDDLGHYNVQQAIGSMLGGQLADDRIGRKSGGRAGVMTAESLLRDLKRRRVMLANKTEHMLSLPDDVIVQALDAAKR